MVSSMISSQLFRVPFICLYQNVVRFTNNIGGAATKIRDEIVERKVGFSGKYKQNVMNGCVVLAKRVKNTGVGNPLLITSCLKNATGRNT